MAPHRVRARRFLVVGLLLALCSVAAASAETPELSDLLVRFDAVQDSIHTLSASFTETTSNPLLKAPIVARGRLYLTKPDAIRWEYTAPEEMRFVISHDVYTGYFPAQKRAERRNIQRFSQRLFRYLGLGQASSELGKFYDIHLEPSTAKDTYLLVLEPRKRRARRRVEEVRFTLDAQRLIPLRVDYRAKDGSGRSIEFSDVQINPDLAATLFTMDIPADVKITRGFSGLPEFDPDDTEQ